jgi:hypothetical protein
VLAEAAEVRDGDFPLTKNEGAKMNTKTSKAAAAHTQGEEKGDGPDTTMAGNGQEVSIEEISDSLKQGIVHSLAGINTIESDIVALVRKTVSDTLRTGGAAAGELVNVVHHVVMGAIAAAEQVGSGMTMSVKSVAKGIVMGVNDVGGDVVAASAETMRSLIKHTAMVGSDIGVVARHAVNGVIEATVESGGNVAQAGKNAVEGAIEEAGKVSVMALKTVKNVLSGMVGLLAESRGAEPDAALHAQAAAKKPHAGTERISH